MGLGRQVEDNPLGESPGPLRLPSRLPNTDTHDTFGD